MLRAATHYTSSIVQLVVAGGVALFLEELLRPADSLQRTLSRMLAPRTGPETLTPVYDESDYCGAAYRDYSN